MATLIVPPITRTEKRDWATLGDPVAEWIEANAVYGPGSKFGQAVVVSDELYAWLLRAYQIFPHDHPRAGRRRFDLCSVEQTKGTGKTENAISIGQAEFHPSAPVRCAGWRRNGRGWIPIGGPVPYPRLIFFAYSEDQVQRTAFGRFRQAIEKSKHASDYHVTLDKIILLGAGGSPAGEAYPLAVSPASADGDLPTWQHVDEPHRWDQKRHHDLMSTVEENALKDRDADAWMMATSTAGRAGANSVQEDILDTAELVARGAAERPGLFFFRRWAPDRMPTTTIEEVEAAILEARGPAASWSGDLPRVVQRFFNPKIDKPYLERVWLGRWIQGGGTAFDPQQWKKLTAPKVDSAPARIPRGAFVTAGFDGGRRRDSTGIVVTDFATGLQVVAGFWERPVDAGDDWEMPAAEVDAAMSAVFETYEVWRLYPDPWYWDDWVGVWSSRWGPDVVVPWWTNRDKAMAHALRRFKAAQDGRLLSHDGDARYSAHIANAYKRDLPGRDDEDLELWTIGKERRDSPKKIDLVVAGTLSWEARMDGITAGAKPRAKAGAVYGF